MRFFFPLAIWRPWSSSRLPEEKKVIVSDAFGTSVLRAMVHVVPVLISATLIAMNMRGVYIGPALGSASGIWKTTFTLAALQLAAKLQEILVVASLTTAAFQIIRYQLLHGDGLPLSLLVAGFSFTKLSFCTTRSIWMNLSGTSVVAMRVSIVLYLLLLGVIALIIGPASAVLLLPRLTNQPMFHDKFWLNGTAADLWPTKLTSAHVGDLSAKQASSNDSCKLATSVYNERCISAGYPKLYDYFTSNPTFYFWDWTVSLREPTFPRMIGGAEAVGRTSPETWSYAPHLATGYRQSQYWWDPSWFMTINANGRSSTVNSQMAAVRTVCLQQNITVASRVLHFPRLKEYEFYMYGFHNQFEEGMNFSSDWVETITVSPDLWSHDGQNFVDPGNVQVQWVNYTAEVVTTGVVIMEAVTSQSHSDRSVLACAVDARWAKSYSDQIDGATQAAISAAPMHQRPYKDIKGYVLNGAEVRGHGFLPINDTSWRHITADLDWLKALTPTVSHISPALNLSTPASTIAGILMYTNHTKIFQVQDWAQYNIGTPFNYYEAIISTFVADGISRVGYARELNSEIFYANGMQTACEKDNAQKLCRGPPPSNDFTEMTIKRELLNIYAFHAKAETDYVSIAISSLYIIIAISHAFYGMVWRRSCCAWEKLEDFAALLLNSRQPLGVLDNTCAGMERARTKALNGRIVVVGKENESYEEATFEEEDGIELQDTMVPRGGEEEVQLVFLDEFRAKSPFGRIEPDMKYGKMD